MCYVFRYEKQTAKALDPMKIIKSLAPAKICIFKVTKPRSETDPKSRFGSRAKPERSHSKFLPAVSQTQIFCGWFTGLGQSELTRVAVLIL